MSEVKLTQSVVASLAPPAGKKDCIVFDRDMPGFGVRVTGKSKTFIVQYTKHGIKRRQPVGRFGEEWTADKARKRALDLLGQVAGGGDPVADEQAKKAAAQQMAAAKAAAAEAQAAADAFTVSRLVDDWAASRAAKKRRPYYLKVALGTMRKHLAAWLNRPAASITKKEVNAMLDRVRVENGDTTANRTLAYSRAAFNHAVRQEMLKSNPFAGIEAPAAETSRKRTLDAIEIGAVYRAAGSLPAPYGACVQVMLLTLQRRNEVARMKWSEISADGTTWTLPDDRAKNGKAHVIHLSAPVQAILQAQLRHLGCPLVFPSTRRTPITAFSDAKEAIDAAVEAERKQQGIEPAALPGWVFHDFRRSGVTMLASAGFPPHIADRLLNHVGGTISGVAAVYQQAEFLPERRAALDAWAAHVVAAAEGAEPGSNVVKLAVGG